jgi:adenylate cyclase
LHRRHLRLVQQHFEAVVDTANPDRNAVRVVVGFADLSGWPARSQALTGDELGEMVSAFEQRVADVLTDRGGRLVKFIGDAAMVVWTDPLVAAEAGMRLIEEFSADELPIRVGLACGQVLAQDGDYHGPVVNLASRLSSAAKADSVLISQELCDLLRESGFVTRRLPPLKVRGYAERVTAYRLRRPEERGGNR